MKRRFGRIQGLVMSLYSPAFYRDVARNWGGFGFWYLVLLLTVTWIPVLAQMQISFREKVNTEFPEVIKNCPTITIKNGQASSDAPQPYEVVDPKTNQLIFVFDTTGKIKSLRDTKAKILLTENKLYMVDDMGREQVHDLRELPDFQFSKELLQSWAEWLSNWVGLLSYPFVMIGSLFRAIVLILIAAILGLIFNSAFGSQVTFGGLMRMAAVGLTLSMYIDVGLSFAKVAVPFWFLIALLLTTLYVAFGTKAASSDVPPALDRDDQYSDIRRDEYRTRDDLDDVPPAPPAPRREGGDSFRA